MTASAALCVRRSRSSPCRHWSDSPRSGILKTQLAGYRIGVPISPPGRRLQCRPTAGPARTKPRCSDRGFFGPRTGLLRLFAPSPLAIWIAARKAGIRRSRSNPAANSCSTSCLEELPRHPASVRIRRRSLARPIAVTIPSAGAAGKKKAGLRRPKLTVWQKKRSQKMSQNLRLRGLHWSQTCV